MNFTFTLLQPEHPTYTVNTMGNSTAFKSTKASLSTQHNTTPFVTQLNVYMPSEQDK
jgi:hypothetical protein